MTKLIANKSLRYAGRIIPAGAGFSAKSKDARLLELIGRARPAPPEEVAPPPKAAVPSKRAYKRRDMLAETAELVRFSTPPAEPADEQPAETD
jgi:hypothetical protein